MKHISCIEKIDNLRALVKQDLREIGIKVPKPKKLKKQQCTKINQENGESNGIFENVLAQVACVHVPKCGYVPRFLVDAADLIKKNIDQEGLFRKSGAVSRIKELKEKIEKGEDLGNANIVDVTALIKQFFKSLPEPLFTSVYHDAFIRCIQLTEKEEATKAVLLLCLLLPGEHLSTIRYMMNLLKQVAENSDKNKMDAANLSVVLAPNLLYLNSKSEKMNSTEEKLLQFQTSVIEVLIRHADEIGFVSDSLHERTLLMTEFFGTDDELDASSDQLEESRDNRKKEKDKKRKRSGSFTGIVSSIAQSITKWRRSTDGKTGNVSNISQASNISDSSHLSNKFNKSTACTTHHEHKHIDLTAATPVVMRKRKASGEAVAFSTSKKKAILQNLQGSALGNTPFTPATALKNMDIKKGSLDTPNIAFSNRGQVAFSATPCTNGKGSRKRLNLFSPGSMRKSKKNVSGSNISTHSVAKRGKPPGKGLFRRLSGGKGDKSEYECSQSEQQVGLRLASGSPPTSEDSDEQNEQGSPLPVILNHSNTSLLQTEQSIISVCDDRNSLNEGFIVDEDLDISQIDTSQVQRDDLPRQCMSDTAIMYGNDSNASSLCRSMSLDAQKIRLRRGQPNSVKTGLLHGEKENVQKLRRSFGLDKSEIGEPMPLLIPDLPQIQNARDLSHIDNLDTTSEEKKAEISVAGSDITDMSTGNLTAQNEEPDNEDQKFPIPVDTTTDSSRNDQEYCNDEINKSEVIDNVENENVFMDSTLGDNLNIDSSTVQKNQTRRSSSTQNLKKPLTAGVSRSQSLCEPSKRTLPNITPNLQISMETHKLLSRAGYLASKSSSSEDITVMAPPPPKIKQADLQIPKHESIMELTTQQRGRVANTAKQFNDISERHRDPHRFPNSTLRKRGVSPIRIPTIFAQNDEEAAKMKDLVSIKQNVVKGQAKLPISTQLLKPTDNVTTASLPPSGSKLQRKPSIYYTADNSRMNESSVLEKVSEEESMDVDTSACINQKDEKANSGEQINKENQKQTDQQKSTPTCPTKVPDIKLPLSTPLTEMVILRTAAGMTPKEVIKKSKSPIKPVKRLRSPSSPCRNSPRKHSPRTNRHHLSSIPCHLQEEMSPL